VLSLFNLHSPFSISIQKFISPYFSIIEFENGEKKSLDWNEKRKVYRLTSILKKKRVGFSVNEFYYTKKV
jgi:hypothetical protein